MSARRSRKMGRVGYLVALTLMAATAVLAIIFKWPLWIVWTVYIGLGIIPATLFIVTYWWRVPNWRRSIEGRHMMALSILLNAVMIEQFIISTMGDWPGHDLFIAVVVAGIVLTMWQRYTMLLLAQHEIDGELTEDTI